MSKDKIKDIDFKIDKLINTLESLENHDLTLQEFMEEINQKFKIHLDKLQEKEISNLDHMNKKIFEIISFAQK